MSFFVVSDGERALPIGTAQDHKRIFDDDRGPNTGGMGAFAPSPLVDARLHERVMREIVEPVIAGMAAEGHPFRGFLYVGLMLTPAGPKVIEFNVRLGDPEAQVILPLIDEPLLPLLVAAATGRLAAVDVPARGRTRRRRRPGVARLSGVVRIRAADSRASTTPSDCRASRCITPAPRCADGQLVTAGGRVLTVVGRGADFAEAIARAYAGVAQISFDGMQYRRDIGRKALRTMQLGDREHRQACSASR